MNLRTEYLEIHEKAYSRLRAGGKFSWSDKEDLNLRETFYLDTLLGAKLPSSAKILVLGCGDGETSLTLAEKAYHVTGWDISPTAVQWAIEKAKNRGLNAQFEEMNIVTKLPREQSFDVIIDDHCLHCIIGDDRRRCFENITALLKPGGFFILRTHCGDPPKGIKQEVLNMWDPDSRCQVHNGVAGRYFGFPEKIIEEITNVSCSILHHKIIVSPNNWDMLEAVFLRE